MNVIHSVEDNNSQIIHVSVNSNDRGATGEKGDSVTNLRITEENRLEATLSNGQTIDGGSVPAIKTKRVFVAEMDGIKRTYILPLNIESSQVSYILMNGVAYSDGYILQSGEITLNYNDLPSGRLEVVINDNSGHVGDINVSINGKTGDIHLKTINGANLDGDGDIEVAALDAFNNEVRTREEADNNLRNSLNDHETRISNNESTVSSHSNNLSSLNASISSINNQMTVLTDDMHEVTDNYVPKTRRINDKFLSHDVRLNADDVEALPITAGITHPVRGELVVNGHITAENATQDNHVVTKAQLDAKVAEVVNSAPETLDTLEELSKALGDDPNFATTMANKIGTVDKKIDTEVNKLANKVEVNTEDLKTTKEKTNANSTNISLLNSTVATNKLSSDTQFSNVAKEQDEQNNLISDILNAFSKESEKGTNLKLNSSATKVLGMTIYGATEQIKTSGKNAIDYSARNIGVWQCVVENYNNGVKIIAKAFSGVAFVSKTIPNSSSLLGKTITVSAKTSGSVTQCAIYALKGIAAYERLATLPANGGTFKLPDNFPADRNGFGVLFYVSQNSTSIVTDVQVELGATATDYEPYSGGYSNLFDEFSNLPLSRDGVTLSSQNGVLKLTGQPTADWIPLTSRNITSFLQDKQTYTVFQPNIYGVKLYPEVIAQRKDGGPSKSWNGQYNRTLIFDVDFDTYSSYSMKLQMGPKSAYPEPITFYNNYALFVGNYTTENLPEYSPYNTGLASPRPRLPQVVRESSGGNIKVLSKNLLKVKNIPASQSQTTISATVNQDGSITAAGENKNVWGMNFTDDEACPRIEEGTKVTMSIDRPLPYKLILSCWASTGGPSFQFPLAIINAGSTSVTNVAQYTAFSGHLVISLSKIGKQINETFKVQLEYGDTATPFVPHEFSEFTIPSGLNLYKLTDDIYDEIRLENGVAKTIKRVGKLELSGEENNIGLYSTRADGSLGFQLRNPSGEFLFTQQQELATVVSSHFSILREPSAIGNNDFSSGIGLFKSGNDTYPRYTNNITIWLSFIDMQRLGITDINTFKNWLKSEKAKGTPVTVYYEMKIPTEEEITDPTLLTELKKLMEMRTYDGTTNISIVGTGLMPEIKVKYMRKIRE